MRRRKYNLPIYIVLAVIVCLVVFIAYQAYPTIKDRIASQKGIYLFRKILCQVCAVKITLSPPLQQVGRLDVCQRLSASAYLPQAVPMPVGTGLHQVGMEHSLHASPGTEIGADIGVSRSDGKPLLAIGTPGKLQAAPAVGMGVGEQVNTVWLVHGTRMAGLYRKGENCEEAQGPQGSEIGHVF